jgi:hypothetical protein
VKQNCVGIDLYTAKSPIPGARQTGNIAMDFSYMKIQELGTIDEEGVPVTSIFACCRTWRDWADRCLRGCHSWSWTCVAAAT